MAGIGDASVNRFTPTTTISPDSCACCNAYALRAMASWKNPRSIALAAPPSSSTCAISRRGPLLELVGETLDVVAPTEWVHHLGHPALVSDYLLGAQGQRRRFGGRQRQRLVVSVGVQ